MTEAFNALYYTCTLIEYVARETKNFPEAVVQKAGVKHIKHFYDLADVYHCQTFEESSDEFLQKIGGIEQGKRDMTQYDTVPSCTAIGKDYAYLIDELAKEEGKPYVDLIVEVLNSFFSRAVSNFNSSFFYENLSYHMACYKAGKILS